MTVTASKVEQAFKNNDDIYWGDFAWYLSSGRLQALNIDGVEYPVEFVDSYTGSEGDWSAETYVIFKVDGKTFKKTGHYQSHYGDDWDGPVYEAVPVEKVVTEWVTAPEDEVEDDSPFTLAEVEQAVNETGDGWGEMGWGDNDLTIRGKTYTAKAVEYKGGEGQGEYTAVIFEVDGRLFRKEGYYASHYGTDWDGDFSEVEVYEKTVKDYRTV